MPRPKKTSSNRPRPPDDASQAKPRKASPRKTGPAPKLIVLMEDAHLLAIDKPAGILTVRDSQGQGRNLEDAVRRRSLRSGEESFAVHRLDRDTSGVILFAKTPRSRDSLLAAFKERTIRKSYLALVHGRPREASGTLQTYIAERGMTAISSRHPIPGGRVATTDFEILERLDGTTLVLASPKTGRLNQIRVHFADIGCPLVGERKYAVASRYPLRFRRPVLHAMKLEFAHPASGKKLVVESPLPADVVSLLQQLGSTRHDAR